MSAAATRASSRPTKSSACRTRRASVTEGIDHTEGVGGTGFYEDYYANAEYSIGALGSDVEMNSGGAAIVAIGKSGGNTLSGLYHISYEPGEFVGDNNNDELRARGFTGNPNLLFWEGHADLGGPIAKDKAWFFGAYNHFKIDKVVSGVPQELATDIGIFDNLTGKGTGKLGQNNTLIGYYQQGHKQKPQRGLSSLGHLSPSRRRTAGRGCTRASSSA